MYWIYIKLPSRIQLKNKMVQPSWENIPSEEVKKMIRLQNMWEHQFDKKQKNEKDKSNFDMEKIEMYHMAQSKIDTETIIGLFTAIHVIV